MNGPMVTRLRVLAIGGPVAGVGNSQGAWTERRGVKLVLELGGQRGVGEASPLPGYSPDTLERSERGLRALAEELPFDPGSLSTRLSPSARFAFETAVADALARGCGVSVAELMTGGSRSPTGLGLAHLIDATRPVDAARAVEEACARGAAALKLKIGRDLVSEMAVFDLCRAMAPGLPIRVDANRAFDQGNLGEALATLADRDVELIEELASPRRLLERDELPSNLALDETLAEDGAEEVLTDLAERGALAAVIVKPAVCGGLSAAQTWARRAHSLGADVVISHLFDGPIAMAACCELALAQGPMRAQGLAPHPAMRALGEETVVQLKSGLLRASPYPGLGFEDAQ